ncbi:MAG: PhzF family phenazine biosynthesis isomerase [Legionellales bacterium]|nr:PhzF family phenazine biosynthesis isomerase [Legionellales bacterium]
MSNILKFWQVDAFTNQRFKGNPAAVFLLNTALSDTLMQNIAIEMNLSETAFVLNQEGQNPLLRWFTPMGEIDLCGHATLASAHICLSEIHPHLNEITFDTKFVGPLHVAKNQTGYTINFPSRLGDKLPLSKIPTSVLDALTDAQPIDAYQARDLMLVYDNEQTIQTMSPNFTALMDYPHFIIVTARSNHSPYDFISRFFCAADGILEDPVTGSAHCTTTPYWATKLDKLHLKAYQASKRGGELTLEVKGNRILMTGEAITILDGTMR